MLLALTLPTLTVPAVPLKLATVEAVALAQVTSLTPLNQSDVVEASQVPGPPLPLLFCIGSQVKVVPGAAKMPVMSTAVLAAPVGVAPYMSSIVRSRLSWLYLVPVLPAIRFAPE